MSFPGPSAALRKDHADQQTGTSGRQRRTASL